MLGCYLGYLYAAMFPTSGCTCSCSCWAGGDTHASGQEASLPLPLNMTTFVDGQESKSLTTQILIEWWSLRRPPPGAVRRLRMSGPLAPPSGHLFCESRDACQSQDTQL